MQRIDSKQNATIKRLVSLKTAKGRKTNNQYPIEGARLVREAAEMDMPLDVLAVEEDAVDAYGDIIQYAQGLNVPVLMVPDSIMDRLCDTTNPQGIYAALPLPDNRLDAGAKRILALDGVSDPGNMGTMLRSAAAFGIADVLVGEGCVDVFSPKCVRAGMGAHFRLRFQLPDDLAEILDAYKCRGYDIIGASVDGDETLPALKDTIVCVIGSEAHGLSDSVMARCTSLYRIPMTAQIESLNAAVAAGILMFQCHSKQSGIE